MELSLVLINLMVKLGLAAALAAALVRSVEFKALLYREERSLRDRLYLVFWLVISEWIGKALAAGVWKFGATPSPIVGDLSLETTILLGALAGRFAGIVGGALLALFAAKLARTPRSLTTALGLSGSAMLGASLWLMTEATPHPGPWTLLPIVGTLFLLVSGAGQTNVVSRALSIAPLVKIGDWFA